MRLLRTLLAELHKSLTLPATWAGAAVTVLGTVGITLLNAFSARSAVENGEPWGLTAPFEVGFAAMPLGTVGAVVLGVTAFGSEYAANSPDAGGGRQIMTTLTAMPSRIRVLLAKALSLILLVAASAAVAIPACYGIARGILGDTVPETVTVDEALAQSGGAALYWTLMGLSALAITAMARSGVVPLIVLIANSGLVSFSLLLSNLTPLAFWLPDLAGMRLYGTLSMVEGGLEPLLGGFVMGAWAAVLLGIAGAVFARREA